MKGLDGQRIVQIECGGMHTVALTDDGKVTARSFVTILFVFKYFSTFSILVFYRIRATP